jgi:hypothetical protein
VSAKEEAEDELVGAFRYDGEPVLVIGGVTGTGAAAAQTADKG